MAMPAAAQNAPGVPDAPGHPDFASLNPGYALN
jgi:hypothetical protein